MEEKLFELNKWFTSLTVAQKERIASKVMGKEILYPECTDVWNSMSFRKKNEVHDHCTDKHGYLLPEWKEGQGMSY